ncbi:nitrilase [Maritimibacter sp. 55A14]|uniref:nitrilase-related carbon-nitrogen hydrolase n=1 Tax=Maritimibacter sp. 55A14 TaxID=2174844 RepID=UPI000D603AFB|nr:nitrilase-related carbon-nitrogen hydrolase [Maritimibacter sp. 55A14]PWE34361.1 nitrilase [Maritimibacter sp. 55A14]
MTVTLSLTLWAADLARPLGGPQDWLDGLDKVAAEAAAQGSALLVAPEYVSEAWLIWQKPGFAARDEAALMAQAGAAMGPGIQGVADRHGIDILAGTWPVADGAGRYQNGAHLYRAGGASPLVQRKLCPTPNERAPDRWAIRPHDGLSVFGWNGLTCAILTCLDIELPALSARLAREAPGLDLILCPSMTRQMSGYSRVFACARARAVELMATVAVVGVTGTTPLGEGRPNVSGAAVYLPCEPALGFDGRFAEIGPFDAAPAGDPLGLRLHARDIPVGLIRQLRGAGAEVWPGGWDASGLRIERG